MSPDYPGELHGEETAPQQSPNYFRIAWRRKSLIALSLVVVLVVGSLYYVRCVPVYRSEAQVLVVKKRPDAVTGEATPLSHFEDYVSTHRILIKSPLIVEQAVKTGKLSSLKTFSGSQDDIVQEVIKNLSANKVTTDSTGNSNSILQLEFRGPVADECGVVVNAIVESYKAFLDETYRNMTDDTVQLITEARNVLDKDLAEKEQEYREFRKITPAIWHGREDTNPGMSRLALIESQRTKNLLRRTTLEGQVSTIERARRAGKEPEELLALVTGLSNQAIEARDAGDAVTSDPASASVKGQLLPLMLEQTSLLERYGPNHPRVRAVNQKIEATRRLIELPSFAYSSNYGSADNSGTVSTSNLVQTYENKLHEELDRIATNEQALLKLYEQEREAAQELASYEIEDAQFRSGIARTQGLYDALVKRLQEAGMVKDYGGFDARIIAPAAIGTKVFPSGIQVLGVSVLLGLLGGVGLVYVAEITDKRFRTPEEIRQRLGWPVLGHVPLFEASGQPAVAAGNLDSTLFTHYYPRSPGAEACRGIRTALYFSNAGEGHKLIQMTSANRGDGKSTVLANVAISFAQSAKKTLLIDADMRKPRQHRLFGVSNRTGLSSVLGNDAEVSDAIQKSEVRDLWILPCGPIPPDPAELLSSPRFRELLGLLREQYDYVLVDTGPVLEVTDPCVVAPHVDGVLLTVRISKRSRLQAQRAKEILATLDAKVLGVVVNAVDGSLSAGYEYGSYGYGYGHGESYQYHDDADADADGDEDGNDEHRSQARLTSEITRS